VLFILCFVNSCDFLYLVSLPVYFIKILYWFMWESSLQLNLFMSHNVICRVATDLFQASGILACNIPGKVTVLLLYIIGSSKIK